MPEVNDITAADLIFVCTDIGRGHPSYLDGLLEQSGRNVPGLSFYRTNVFDSSSGLSLQAWKLVRRLYFWGARGGLITSAYSWLRRRSRSGGEGGVLSGILGRDIKRRLAAKRGVIVISHPLLAACLAGSGPAVYQHGELVCPYEAAVAGVEKVFVPLPETAQAMIQLGVSAPKVFVTGLCIEKELVERARPAFEKRMERLKSPAPLTAALFSSGAYPPAHLQKLMYAGRSLLEAGHRVVFFAGGSRQVAEKFEAYYRNVGFASAAGRDEGAPLQIVVATDRQDENHQVAARFDQFDFFIAPAHERTNWAVGLGLPLFMLSPHIGSFAPLNAALAGRLGVAQEIAGVRGVSEFAAWVGQLRRGGKLAAMADRGFGKAPIDGFQKGAAFLAAMVRQGS